jgi:hypothetical protein
MYFNVDLVPKPAHQLTAKRHIADQYLPPQPKGFGQPYHTTMSSSCLKPRAAKTG